ncbi:CoA transferase subunit B [Budviciaceae bacterium CWB-B4]|uniref:CoA transferase subunit B n=1 Tax=Limnobaculum xujianqingii TaxID=2738837 RepID=A0A9D7FQL4_9GAMM|nr:3-oxoacid CoA-transferase subunit B [Limnobaculum xujianqingii]MBK5071743.1 CoA transferase subunit B [Limnobaculum xujianqingii]MBK5175052.1 CoA transferase subunit B [Limnobaculum xujianqingii]
MNAKEIIARRVAKELKDGDVVNLGIGLPTQVANYLPDDVHVTLQSENGFLGLGPITQEDPNLVNAGGQPCGMLPGAAMFDSAFSFALIRGGHVDLCVLGGLQVDEQANLANWVVPGKMVPGMGGAMDLVVGAKKVIIAMEHNAKDGGAKLLHRCNFPLTAQGKVSMVVTELAVFSFINQQMVLIEISDDTTVDKLRELTEANFTVSPELRPMQVN